MTSIFEYDDYKRFVRERVQQMPHRGRGQYRSMAKHMRVHTTLISHVLRGTKDFTSEQACTLGSFLSLPELEVDYLLALVERNRAGTAELGAAVERRLTILRERHQQIEHRTPGARTLSSEERATFYSQWYYSAVRLAASLPGMSGASDIATRLGVPLERVHAALRFLVDSELLVPEPAGYRLAVKRTHLGSDSPLIALHHRNWRLRAMSQYDAMTPKDFAFTAPISLSREDFARVRALLVECVSEITAVVEPSPCESLAVLNIDWLEL